ncbi:MAG: outer membrane lipid asymmetry maintenance protein MlaD [Verrucomicrobia bacterium]|nr:outer membrane lipid asymmetry maintenance protein MlaD [Verrucomicrobiota bacterium]
MKQSKLELIVGAFVLAGLIAVGYLALKIGAGSLVGTDTYLMRARFSNSGGLNPGSNVVIAGVPVGRVTVVTLNPADFSALVEFRLEKAVKLPADSIASIKTTGLIGDKYLALAPGGDEAMLAPGTTITETESAVDIESLISRFAFGNVDKKESK